MMGMVKKLIGKFKKEKRTVYCRPEKVAHLKSLGWTPGKKKGDLVTMTK